MSSKVIWIFNQTAGKPDSGWGERHYYLAKHWAEKGYKTKIFSGSYNHLFINQPKIGKQTFTEEKIDKNLSFFWVKIPKYNGASVFRIWNMILFSFKLLFFKDEFREKPDIILVSSMPLFQIIPGYYFKKKFKVKKMIFEIRDLWPLTPVSLKNYSKFHPVIIAMRWIEKMGYRKADFIVSVLPYANIYIDKISKKPDKFTWIPNGIDTNLSSLKKLPGNIRDMIPKDKFIIGYAGTMGLANALEYFVDASILLKNNRDIHFVLVGDGYLKSSYLAKTKGNSNITFINKIPKGQVQDLLTYFDICFLGRYDIDLYKYGVSYNKYFDYMLAKKPILEASKPIGSPAEKAGCTLLVAPESPEAIVQGILNLFNKPQKMLIEMGDKGYNYVKKYHNFEYLSYKYLKLF